MGASTSKSDLLFKSIKSDKTDEIEKLLNKSNINEKINKEQTQTSLMVASEYNAYRSIGYILSLEPDFTIEDRKRNALFIAVEKDNIFIVKDLEKAGMDPNKANELGLNSLDYSILTMSYRCAFYLYHTSNVPLKDADWYLEKLQANKSKARENFNLLLFIDCLEKKIERDYTPSFYLSKKQKLDLDNQIPDPNETWAHFFRRMIKFELYQPPMIDKDLVTAEKKNTIYMKVQTKLLEIEYNKKSILLNNLVDLNAKTGGRRDEEMKAVNADNNFQLQSNMKLIREDEPKTDRLDNHDILVINNRQDTLGNSKDIL